MLALQHRIKTLLEASGLEWFSAPTQIFIENTAGLTFLYNLATAQLTAPVIVIQSHGGENDRRPQGAALLTERFALLFTETPLYNTTGRHLIEGVELAIQTLHEAPVHCDNTKPGYPRFHVLSHELLDAGTTRREHLLILHCPYVVVPTRLSVPAPTPPTP